MAAIFAQGVLILLFTRYVYGVFWGGDIPLILLIIFVMCFLTVSLGSFVGMAAKDRRITTAVLQIMVPVTTFISSGYFKFQISDPVLNAIISRAIPNAMAQTAIFNTVYGGPAYVTYNMIAVIAAAGAVFIIGTVIAGRRIKA
jgi:ABC-2 type transport system permease protein